MSLTVNDFLRSTDRQELCVMGWVYPIHSVEVVILTFYCHIGADVSPKVSHEHKEVGFFPIHQLDEIPLPDGYKKAIRDAYRKKQSDATQLATFFPGAAQR